MAQKSYIPTDFHIRLRKSLLAANHQRRGATTALATALWVQEIKLRTGRRSAYELEKWIEPEAFGRNSYGDIFHHNKWSKYEIGRHTPTRKLVQQVENLLPGTARILRHPIWKLLICKSWSATDSEQWLSQLSPEVRTVLQVRQGNAPFGKVMCQSLTGVQIKMLERRASLDTLTALTVFIFNAIAKDDQQKAFTLSESLFRVLLVLCGFIPFTFFAFELFVFFNSRIFSVVTHDGIGFDFKDFDFAEAAWLLSKMMLVLEDNGVANGIEPHAAIRIKLKLLAGDYGFDVCFAMLPPLKPCVQRDEESEQAYEHCERINRKRAWGLSVLREDGCERFPPRWLK